MPLLGLQFSTTALIGKCIGELNVPAAKRNLHLIQAIGFIVGLCIGLIYLLFWPYIVEIYSNIDEVKEETSKVLVLLAIFT